MRERKRLQSHFKISGYLRYPFELIAVDSVPFWVHSRLMELSHGSKNRLNLIQKEELSQKRKQAGQGREKHLSTLIRRLKRIVGRVLLTLSYNRKTLKLGNQPDRKSKTNHRELSTHEGNINPHCPVCGVVPHNLAIHDEWRLLNSPENADKIAADREATGNSGNRGQQSATSPSAGTGTPTGCGICGSTAAFDGWLGINLCPKCGAHETAGGWQRR